MQGTWRCCGSDARISDPGVYSVLGKRVKTILGAMHMHDIHSGRDQVKLHGYEVGKKVLGE